MVRKNARVRASPIHEFQAGAASYAHVRHVAPWRTRHHPGIAEALKRVQFRGVFTLVYVDGGHCSRDGLRFHIDLQVTAVIVGHKP
jgi:hypothetical protein